MKNDSRSANSERRRKSKERTETVESICNYIRAHLDSELTLGTLEHEFGMSRFTLQKTFKEIMGISPRKYIEECRIYLLKRNIKGGESIPRAIYGAGYQSQSWLYEDSSSKLGMTPSAYRNGGKGIDIFYLTSKCDLGYVLVASTAHGICSVNLADDEGMLISDLNKEFPKANPVKSELVRGSLDAILSYFKGQLLALPVDIGGTEFQRRVWTALLSIPYGETRSYSDIAHAIGSPNSSRAVANACARNPVPLVIPCHRVIRRSGDLGGYGFGTEKKRYLIELEKSKLGRPK